MLSAQYLVSVQSQSGKFKLLLLVALQELFLTQMLAGQFFITRPIALPCYEIRHFGETYLLRLTSSFRHTGTKFAFFACMYR